MKMTWEETEKIDREAMALSKKFNSALALPDENRREIVDKIVAEIEEFYRRTGRTVLSATYDE
jgi:L-serine deaminase